MSKGTSIRNDMRFGDSFKHLQLKGYRNINELFVQDSQLHACESLFGDWNAEVMILAQDAANFSSLKLLLDEEKTNPFRHSSSNRTNINLYTILSSLNRFDMGDLYKPNNRNCGVYFANAIWLLKDSVGMSGAITSKEDAYKVNQEVFVATLENLKNLKIILTLGEHSYNFIKQFFTNQISTDWHTSVINNTLHEVHIENSRFFIGSIYHTSNRGMIARAKLNGVRGLNSCAEGIEITKLDVQKLFNNL